MGGVVESGMISSSSLSNQFSSYSSRTRSSRRFFGGVLGGVGASLASFSSLRNVESES